MDGHQLDLVVVFAIIRVGVECDVLQVGVDRIVLILVFFLVEADGLDQLLEVLQPLFFGVRAILRE